MPNDDKSMPRQATDGAGRGACLRPKFIGKILAAAGPSKGTSPKGPPLALAGNMPPLPTVGVTHPDPRISHLLIVH